MSSSYHLSAFLFHRRTKSLSLRILKEKYFSTNTLIRAVDPFRQLDQLVPASLAEKLCLPSPFLFATEKHLSALGHNNSDISID